MASFIQHLYTYKYKNIGLVTLRIGIGIMLFFHGLHKLTAGVTEWEKLGIEFIKIIGITVFPGFFGFLAAFFQLAGGICIALGWLCPMASAAVATTTVVATIVLLYQGDSFSHYSHPIEMSIMLISFIMIGPGKYSLDDYLTKDYNKISIMK
jgi:putative oxidoreductase